MPDEKKFNVPMYLAFGPLAVAIDWESGIEAYVEAVRAEEAAEDAVRRLEDRRAKARALTP